MVVDTFWLATVGRPRRTVAWANSLVVGSTFLLRVDAPAAGGRWCADAGRPTRFKPSSPSPPDAVRDGSAKLGHPVQNVTREHGLTPLPR